MHKYRHHITHVDQRICLQMAPHYGNQTQLLQNQSQLLQSGNPQLSIAGTKCKKKLFVANSEYNYSQNRGAHFIFYNFLILKQPD